MKRSLVLALLVFLGLLPAPSHSACRNPYLAEEGPPFLIQPAAASGKVEIRWFGHSFFQLTSSSGTVILTDPFGPMGFPLPDVWGHVVTVGREHGNHNNVGLVKGKPVVLRGLKANSMRETLAAVSSLIGERQVAWVIDPEAFARHRIERAPTFVLSLDDRADTPTSCGTDCRSPTAFVSVSGDVSLDHALDTLARQRPEARPLVAPLLARLKGP